MAPAIEKGNHVLMEGMTYLRRAPRRGDVVVFRTEGIDLAQPDTVYVKRVVGEPGDRLLLSDGKLFINDQLMVLTNVAGPINYSSLPLFGAQTNLTVPAGCYFVLGDNSLNSLDSRMWGCVPRGNIMGRISYCYWPLDRIGAVQ